MNKLKLQLDDLTVDSFETVQTERQKGTVFGEQGCTCQTVCSCPGCPTCDSCVYTCAYTCDDQTCAGGTCEGSCVDDTCDISQWNTCWKICGPDRPM